MTASGPISSPSIGFLTVRDFPELGLIGGYLVLNTTGRPLEFHCTAPVRPNRTQEILYGPTLVPYLYGEQIAQTLLGKAKAKPLFICTDVEPALAVRNFVATPVTLVSENKAASDKLHCFQLGTREAAVFANRQQDQEAIATLWREHAEELDLLEPFNRLHEAIDEAQRGAARSAAA
ncbi:MAG: hypothetical protein CMJ64_04615 [Planctomycetaceae bacterium]|nr:hypothetical protein [Planctomycetaceae bacterium]